MTKTEQNRVLAWRLKVLREASAAPRNAAQIRKRAIAAPSWKSVGREVPWSATSGSCEARRKADGQNCSRIQSGQGGQI